MKDDRLYVHHMIERCHRITRFVAPGKEAFLDSEALQDAVIRNVEVLVHDYIGVDLDEVWNVAFYRIPELQTVLERFLKGESAGSADVL